jgi:hypothetical protein
MSTDVGRKLQSCREEEEEEDENAQTLTSHPLKKQKKHMQFNKTHLDQLVSSTTTDFRVSIESHAGSTKVSPKLPFSFYTRSSIFLPQSSNPDCSAPLLFSKLQKKLKNEAPFLHFI